MDFYDEDNDQFLETPPENPLVSFTAHVPPASDLVLPDLPLSPNCPLWRKVAGSLAFWESINAPPYVLQFIRNGVYVPPVRPIPPFHRPSPPLTSR